MRYSHTKIELLIHHSRRRRFFFDNMKEAQVLISQLSKSAPSILRTHAGMGIDKFLNRNRRHEHHTQALFYNILRGCACNQMKATNMNEHADVYGALGMICVKMLDTCINDLLADSVHMHLYNLRGSRRDSFKCEHPFQI